MISKPWRRLPFGVIVTLAAATAVQAQDPQREVELPTEEVSAQRGGAKTTPTVEQADQELRAIPGATTLIQDEQFRRRNIKDISDILQLAPSVYNQSRYGNSETRLSVRGSGIRQTFNAVGVRLLRNGMPLSEADGNVRPQLIDPLIVEYAEVLPGANGLIYGSSTLGGAINFVTPTGHTADPLKLRVAVGSDDFTQVQVQTGRVLDNGMDYYLSFNTTDYDGFRTNSEERSMNFYGNFGVPLNDTWELRVHLNGQDSDLALPGSLTLAATKMNPRQANTASANVNSVRDMDLVRTDVQLSADLGEDESLDLGLSFQWLEMYHPLPFPFSTGGGLNRQDRRDYSAFARYRTTTEALGTEHEIVAGVFAILGQNEGTRFGISTGTQDRDVENESLTAEIFIEDRIRMSDTVRAVLGGQIALASREQTVNLGAGLSSQDEDYFGFQPKLGFLWDPSEDTQVFGSVARSFEPPTDGSISNTSGILDEQTAWTVELGARGNLGENTTYQAAVYHSWVSDELLTVENPPGSSNFETGNADALHFGVELAAAHYMPLGEADDNGGQNGVRVTGTYTYSQFKFDDDPTWRSNEIPGIPPHVFRADVTYESRRGYWAGVNVEVASSQYVDFANTFNNESFAILGASAGYDSGENWTTFLELINLTDEEYASNTSITTNANGMDTGAFNPGQPFSLFAGMEITL